MRMMTVHTIPGRELTESAQAEFYGLLQSPTCICAERGWVKQSLGESIVIVIRA
jgi:hypothetical protein